MICNDYGYSGIEIQEMMQKKTASFLMPSNL